MQEQLELCQKMSFVRSRGLDNASELGERVEKLSDWREHVRAHPVPITLAVAALAYWAVPAKRNASQPTLSSRATNSVKADADTSDDAAKTAGIAGMGGVAMGFLGSLIGNAVRSYVSEQIQTLITSRGNHAASQQRQTPFSGF